MVRNWGSKQGFSLIKINKHCWSRLFPGADAAECFRLDAQVGCQHVLGNFLEELGVALHQLLVSVFGAVVQKGIKAAGNGEIKIFGDKPSQPLKVFVPVIQRKEVIFINLVDDRRLERFYVMFGGVAAEEAAVVGDKIPREKECGDVLLPFLYIVKPKDPLADKGYIIANFPLPEDEFLFGNRLFVATGDEIGPFAVVECQKAVKITPDLIHVQKSGKVYPRMKVQKKVGNNG